jgi:hypothetical protein
VEPSTHRTTPEVAAARDRMMQTAKAWQAVAPRDGDEVDPLTDDQLKLLVEALSAQRTYLDARAAEQEPQVICLP